MPGTLKIIILKRWFIAYLIKKFLTTSFLTNFCIQPGVLPYHCRFNIYNRYI